MLVIGRLMEKAYCYFAISLLMGAYVGLPDKFAGGGDAAATAANFGEQHNIFYRLSDALVFVGLLVLFSVRWRQVFVVLRSSAAVNAFVILALASTAWSIDPELTLRRVFTLMTAVGFAYYLASRFAPIEVIRVVSGATTLAGIASAGLAILVPRVGQMQWSVYDPDIAGAWDGVFRHKNFLGATMVVACLTTGWLLTQERRRRFIRLAAFVLCLGVAVMSRSRTSQMAILTILPFGLMIRSVRLPGVLRLWVFYLLLLGALAFGLLVTDFFSYIMYALGKDPSLTGRLPLWNMLVIEISRKPLLGYGYGAFFGPNNTDLDYIAQMIGWIAPEAHQGYLELTIQVGMVGLLIGVWLVISTISRALRAIQDRALPWAGVAAVYALVLLVTSMTEASLMPPQNLSTVLLPYFYSALGLEAVRRKAGLRSPVGGGEAVFPRAV
jgi:exopolysaccharide production protein ExoQ